MDSLEIQLKDKKSCIGSFISWDRLERMFLANGELRQNETLTHVKVDDCGIYYYIDDVDKVKKVR